MKNTETKTETKNKGQAMQSVTYEITTKKAGWDGFQKLTITRKFHTDLTMAAFVEKIIARDNFSRIISYNR